MYVLIVGDNLQNLHCLYSSGGCWFFKEGKLAFGHINCQFIYIYR